MSSFVRTAGRGVADLRPVRLERHHTVHAEGSVLVSFGQTRVLCTASVEEKVPPHKRGSGEGWVTAEYGMLPRSTHTRDPAPDRPLHAHRVRPVGPGRAHHSSGL